MRALAVAGATRSSLYPELPTMAEAGVAGFEASAWFGLVAPAGTPPAVMKVLVETTERLLKEPAMVARFAELGAEPGSLVGPAFGTYLRSEADKWSAIAKTAGLNPQ